MGSERTEPQKNSWNEWDSSFSASIDNIYAYILSMVPAYLELKTWYRESKVYNLPTASPCSLN